MSLKKELNNTICDAPLLLQIKNIQNYPRPQLVNLWINFKSTDELTIQAVTRACPSLSASNIIGRQISASLPIKEVIALSNLECVERLKGSKTLKLANK